MPTSDGRLTAREAAALAMKVGFSEADAVTVVAIGYAESGLDPKKFNNVPPDLSYGWMQINMIGSLGADRKKRYGITRNEDLFNPSYNIAIAFRIFQDAGNKFTDWSTWLHGTWVAYRGIGMFGVQQAKGGGLDTTIAALNKNLKVQGWSSPLDALKDILKASSIGGAIVGEAAGVGDPFEDIASFVTNQENWFRVAAVLGGAIFLILVTFLLVTDTVVGQLTRKVVKGVGKAK